MFCTPQPTPYDLCFRLFGFHIRVHPMYWLCTLFMGPTDLNRPDAGPIIAIWMLCAFASIVIHELGHAFAFRFYRCESAGIWLYWFGGVATAIERPRGHWPNIFISLAGPAAQFLLCGILYLSNKTEPWISYGLPYSFYFYIFLFSVSLSWAMFNLLPIWPLDGGQVCREICHWLRIRNAEERSLKISFGTALVMIGIGLAVNFGHYELFDWIPWWFPIRSGMLCILFLASMAYANYEELQMLKRERGFYSENDW